MKYRLETLNNCWGNKIAAGVMKQLLETIKQLLGTIKQLLETLYNCWGNETTTEDQAQIDTKYKFDAFLRNATSEFT
mgnify:CR=1 FL=1